MFSCDWAFLGVSDNILDDPFHYHTAHSQRHCIIQTLIRTSPNSANLRGETRVGCATLAVLLEAGHLSKPEKLLKQLSSLSNALSHFNVAARIPTQSG